MLQLLLPSPLRFAIPFVTPTSNNDDIGGGGDDVDDDDPVLSRLEYFSGGWVPSGKLSGEDEINASGAVAVPPPAPAPPAAAAFIEPRFALIEVLPKGAAAPSLTPWPCCCCCPDFTAAVGAARLVRPPTISAATGAAVAASYMAPDSRPDSDIDDVRSGPEELVFARRAPTLGTSPAATAAAAAACACRQALSAEDCDVFLTEDADADEDDADDDADDAVAVLVGEEDVVFDDIDEDVEDSPPVERAAGAPPPPPPPLPPPLGAEGTPPAEKGRRPSTPAIR